MFCANMWRGSIHAYRLEAIGPASQIAVQEFRIERNHQIMLAYDTGTDARAIDGLARLDHAIEAGLMLGWTGCVPAILSAASPSINDPAISIRAGVGYYRACSVRGAIGLSHRGNNFTSAGRTQRAAEAPALVVLFTEFVDSVMAELLLDSLKRMANRHAVIS